MPFPFMTGYSVPQHAVEGFFGTLREELILENADISITFCVLGMIGMICLHDDDLKGVL